MNYIQGTIGLSFILSVDKAVNIQWYIDAEFAVHKYMKSHTCGSITSVTVGDYAQSRKQKLNTNSSTEANIVGLGGVLSQVIRTRYLLKEQGYRNYDNIIYQDNQSPIKLENNGR